MKIYFLEDESYFAPHDILVISLKSAPIFDVSINIFKALFELFCVLLDGLLLVDQMGLQTYVPLPISFTFLCLLTFHFYNPLLNLFLVFLRFSSICSSCSIRCHLCAAHLA